MAWSPDGGKFAIGDAEGLIWIRDAATEELLVVLEGHQRGVNSVAWDRGGGRIVSASSDGTARIWSAESGKSLTVYREHRGEVYCVAWDPPNDRIASGSDYGTVHVWDARTGNKICGIERHDSTVMSVAWDPTGLRVASGSYDATVRIWDMERLLMVLAGHRDAVFAVDWDASGEWVASGSGDHTVRIWDTQTGRLRSVLEGAESIANVAWDRTGTRIACGSYGLTARVWDAADGKLLTALPDHESTALAAAWGPDGKHLATGTSGGAIRIWDLETGQLRNALTAHRRAPAALAWSESRQQIAAAAGDGAVRIWEASGKARETLLGHRWNVRAVAWDPNGSRVTSGGDDSAVRIWSAGGGQARHVLEGHSKPVLALAWDGSGKRVASGSADTTVRLWDADRGEPLHVLEGHKGEIAQVAWDGSGKRVASASEDATVRVWDADKGGCLKVLTGHGGSVQSVGWDRTGGRLASGGSDRRVRIWDAASGNPLEILEGHGDTVCRVNWLGVHHVATSDEGGTTILWNLREQKTVARWNYPGWVCDYIGPIGAIGTRQLNDFVRVVELPVGITARAMSVESARMRSTKVVLIGESDQGKTCLAVRLAEDRWEERGTTHGMQIWTLAPKQIGQPESEERREIFLWDLGGQPEYQLIHQAFLHDTTLALFLFDPTRGEQAFGDVEKWSRRLEAQLRGKKAEKILLRSKVDQARDFVVNVERLEQLKREHGFAGYLEISAKFPEMGFGELKRDLARRIDWEQIAIRCRLKLWQSVYDAVTKARQAGAVLLPVAELKRRVEDGDFSEDDFAGAIESMAQQGLVVRLDKFGGEDVLILGVDHIDRYAGCIVRAAKNNPRQIAAVEEAALDDPAMYREMPQDQRIADPGARLGVIAAVKQLLVEKALAFRSHGLLIFPSEYALERPTGAGDLPETVPLHFRFEGAGSNVYASTVCMLERFDRFGPVRLWRNWAQFERGDDVCALHFVERGPGQAKLELGFGATTAEAARNEFVAAVEDHLRFERVEVTLGRGFACGCGKYEFSDETVQARLDRGLHEIECPVCEKRHGIFAHSPGERREWGREWHVSRSGRAGKPSPERREPEECFRILHLSDLHFQEGDEPNTVMQPLLTDLRNFGPVEFLVVSGDLADKANPKGFEHAERFLGALVNELGLTSERVVLTPGNHDVDEAVEVHGFAPKKRLDAAIAKDAVAVAGELCRYEVAERYPQRFERFRAVHHRVTGVDYPLDVGMQCLCRPYEIGLQFLALNSAWRIDEYNRGRIGLNAAARESGIAETRRAAVRARFQKGQKVLRVAVWHHAVSGDRKIPDEDLVYLERLADEGFALVLHGDVHEVRAGVENPFGRGVYVVGAGSVHSAAGGRPESTPCLYNVLEVQRDLSRIRVHVRAQDRAGGRFDEYARWRNPEGSGKVGFFEIERPRVWVAAT